MGCHIGHQLRTLAVEATFHLRRSRYNEYEIVVYGREEETEVTRQTLSVTEVERLPGFGGDVIKSVQALPGVAAVTPQSDGSIRIEVTGHEAVRPVLEHLIAAGVTNVRTSLPDLEEVYVHLIGDRGLEL